MYDTQHKAHQLHTHPATVIVNVMARSERAKAARPSTSVPSSQPPPTPSQELSSTSSDSATADRPLTKRDLDHSQAIQDKGISNEFKQQRIYMDGRFEGIDRRFEGIEGRFANTAAREPWDDVRPVEFRNGMAVPSNHPDKLLKVWLLQRSRHRKLPVHIYITRMLTYEVSRE